MRQPRISMYEVQPFTRLQGLDGISDAQVHEHLTLYGSHVRQVNALNARLAAIRAQGRASGQDPEFAELVRHLGFEYNGMILHEYYFSNLRPGATLKPAATSALAQALAREFGSVEQWQNDFHAVAGLRGVGWALLCQDPATGRLSNHWVTLHEVGVPAGFKPLLVLDAWEHAFVRDHGAGERGRYLEAFFRNVDWDAADRRLRDPAPARPAAAA